MKKRPTQGFTIVELLIVIVVIALLATISVVAFSGVQARARNTARVSDARKLKNLIEYYVTTNGSASLSALFNFGTYYCIGKNYTDIDPGVDRSCYSFGGAYDRSLPALDSALEVYGNYTVSSLPALIEIDWDEQISGPSLARFSALTHVDGSPGFATIFYALEGSNMDCKLEPLMKYVDSSGGVNNYTLLHSDKNTGYGYTFTYCNVYIAAP